MRRVCGVLVDRTRTRTPAHAHTHTCAQVLCLPLSCLFESQTLGERKHNNIFSLLSLFLPPSPRSLMSHTSLLGRAHLLESLPCSVHQRDEAFERCRGGRSVARQVGSGPGDCGGVGVYSTAGEGASVPAGWRYHDGVPGCYRACRGTRGGWREVG